jgi:hypothetical protein
MTNQARIKQPRDEYLTISCFDNWAEGDKARLFELAEEIRQLELAESIYPVACPTCDYLGMSDDCYQGQCPNCRRRVVKQKHQDPMECRDEVGL